MAEKRLYVNIDAKESMSIGGEVTTPSTYSSVRLHIKGRDIIAFNEGLRVENSAGEIGLRVANNNTIQMGRGANALGLTNTVTMNFNNFSDGLVMSMVNPDGVTNNSTTDNNNITLKFKDDAGTLRSQNLLWTRAYNVATASYRIGTQVTDNILCHVKYGTGANKNQTAISNQTLWTYGTPGATLSVVNREAGATTGTFYLNNSSDNTGLTIGIKTSSDNTFHADVWNWRLQNNHLFEHNYGQKATGDFIMRSLNNDKMFFMDAGQNRVAIGSNDTTVSATLHVKGIGATSGTTSFLVENSAGVDALVVKDNLNVYANGSGGILSNTAFGSNASITNLTGARNTAFGESALRVNTRSENTAFGWETLKANTTGSRNTAVGRSSMSLNSLGSSNTAVGYTALNRTTGSFNTAIGSDSLARLLTASFNTAVGYKSAFLTTTGANNTVIGYTALQNNVTGSDNTLVGKGAMGSNVDGNNNTGVGVDAMHDALTGDGNTVIGYNGMYSIIDGSNNTSVGDTAARENISGTRNISLGYNSGRYNLVSNTLYIHNGLGVTTTIDEKTNSIIYGVMDAVANNQRLTFNSSVGIGVVASTAAKLHVAGNATDGTAALRVEDSAGLSSITIQNNGVVVLREFTVATLPAQVIGGMIIVTDEVGGHTLCVSDGSAWRRVSDGSIAV